MPKEICCNKDDSWNWLEDSLSVVHLEYASQECGITPIFVDAIKKLEVYNTKLIVLFHSIYALAKNIKCMVQLDS